MLMLDADTILDCMPFTTLVDELAALHREPVGIIDEMLMESTDADEHHQPVFHSHRLAARRRPLGAKLITIFPRNNKAAEWPSIQAVYILFEAVNGSPVACLDGTALTWLKTAADSALGSKFLSRNNIQTMLMVGAGQMAPHLVRAHCQIRPSLQHACKSGTDPSTRRRLLWRATGHGLARRRIQHNQLNLEIIRTGSRPDLLGNRLPATGHSSAQWLKSRRSP